MMSETSAVSTHRIPESPASRTSVIEPHRPLLRLCDCCIVLADLLFEGLDFLLVFIARLALALELLPPIAEHLVLLSELVKKSLHRLAPVISAEHPQVSRFN